MSHSERVREAERAVVEAAVARRKAQRKLDHVALLLAVAGEDAAVDALERERVATCPTCGGTGGSTIPVLDGFGNVNGYAPVPCSAGCERGRKVGA